jgi:S-adenosylmethionine decarboxylase
LVPSWEVDVEAYAVSRPLVAAEPGRLPAGWQYLLDLFDCQQPRFDDIGWVRATLLQAAEHAGATVVTDNFHRFSPWGISGVVVIAESHIAVHTWPERRYAALDLFTCGSAMKSDAAVKFLIQSFQSADPQCTRIVRGDGALDAGWPGSPLRPAT